MFYLIGYTIAFASLFIPCAGPQLAQFIVSTFILVAILENRRK